MASEPPTKSSGPGGGTGPSSPPPVTIQIAPPAGSRWTRRLGRMLLLASLLANVILIAERIGMPPRPEFVEEWYAGPYDAPEKIALIHLEGLIEPEIVEEVERRIGTALDDDAVKAIVLQIDSPGGGITASDTLYEIVRQAAEEKPVIASMADLAASGGYYVALGATRLFAQRTTLTGSIGVIALFANVQKLLGDKLGVEMKILKEGARKDAGSPFKEMTEQEEQYLQRLVTDAYEQFKAVVRERRHLSAEQLDRVCDGGVYAGPQAKELGLVDEIGYLADAIDYACQAAEIVGEPRVIRYQRDQGLLGMLSNTWGSRTTAPRIEVQIGPDDLTAWRNGRVMYLWAPGAFQRRHPR